MKAPAPLLSPGLAKDANTPQFELYFAIAGYMMCSSLMLVSNKVAIYLFPAPSFVLWAQLAGTALGVKLFATCGVITVDSLIVSKVKAFMPVALIFLSTIFTNMKTLQYANVETFIVFRCSTPIVISVADYIWLGRELPSTRSWGTLVGLLAAALAYAATDEGFDVKGYAFVTLWYFLFCLDQIYLKHVVESVAMDSTWGRVFYTNFLACMPLIFSAFGTGEVGTIMNGWTVASTTAVLVSVFLGAAMSFFAWKARALVSATYFTVIGNSCKILTIVINCVIWDKHASPFGILCLLICLICAFFYEQAPLREAKMPSSPAIGDMNFNDDPETESGDSIQLIQK